MKKIRYGIIGFGRFADKAIAPAIKLTHNSELIAIQNRSLSKAQAHAAAHGVQLAFDSVAELVAHPDVDAVFIISPNHLHCEETILAAQAGKHVLVEKPMAMDAEECSQMIEVCAHHDVKLMVGHMLRLSPLVHRIKELVGSGVLGRVVHAQTKFIYDGRLSTRAWLTERRVAGGGPIFDIGVHCLDSLRFILDDEVISVQGILQPKPTNEQTEQTAHLVLRFSRDTMAGIVCSYETAVRESYLEILGTEGRMSVADFTIGTQLAKLKIERRIGNDLPDVTVEEIEVPNLYVDEVTLFSESILNNTDPPLSAQNALLNQRVLDAAMNL